MTTIDQETLKQRQRWFPWMTLVAAIVMASGYVLLDLQLVGWPIAVGAPFILLLALTIWALRASVTPRRAGTYLSVAVFTVIVLRTLVGALASSFIASALVSVFAALLTVSPLIFLAALYFHRLR